LIHKKSFRFLQFLALFCIIVFVELIYIHQEFVKEQTLQRKGTIFFYQKTLVPSIALEKTIPFENYPHMQEWITTQ
jgi:hypothetical protein